MITWRKRKEMNELENTKQSLVPNIPPVLINSLIRYGAEGNKEAFKNKSLEIAELWKNIGNEDIYLWILAQFDIGNTITITD